MADQIRIGGIIEAAPNSLIVSNPTFSFNIEPDGCISIVNSFDKLLHQPYVNGSFISPQTHLKEESLQDMIKKIGKILWDRKIFGYISIDFVAFSDPNNIDSKLLQWAIDLDIHMTDAACIATFQDFLLNGELNEDASQYQIRIKMQNVVETPSPREEAKRKNVKETKTREVDRFYYTNQDRYLVYIP